jgi:hypothetical protein
LTTAANLLPVSLTPGENLPPVSLILVGTLTCGDLREFLEKFEMTLKLFSQAWGKMIHKKNLKQKSS